MATARCTWDAVSGVDGYNVYLKSNGENDASAVFEHFNPHNLVAELSNTRHVAQFYTDWIINFLN